MESHHNCKNCGGECHCGKEWAILPVRFALGIMFIAQGLPKLLSLLQGSHNVPNFFAMVGIPLAGFFSWFVSILEVVGGIFLLVGFLTYWVSLLLAVDMIVAVITTVIFKIPFNVSLFVYHLVFFGGLLTTMYGSRFMSLDAKRCKHENHEEKIEKSEKIEKPIIVAPEKKPTKKTKK